MMILKELRALLPLDFGIKDVKRACLSGIFLGITMGICIGMVVNSELNGVSNRLDQNTAVGTNFGIVVIGIGVTGASITVPVWLPVAFIGVSIATTASYFYGETLGDQ